jgi:hypothetical protein
MAASGEHGERFDCTVIALTATTGLDYDTVHAAMAAGGRKNGKRFAFDDKGQAIAKGLGFELQTLDRSEYSAKTMRSVERDRKLQAGAYIVRVRGHVAALVDGKVIDWSEGRLHRIVKIWRVVPSTATPATPIDVPTGPDKWQAFHKYTKQDNLELFT